MTLPRAAKKNGFTLMELMITVAIIAILSALAYPAYLEHVRKSRRADAKTALLDLATRQERFFSVNSIYTSSPVSLGYSSSVTAFPIDVLVSGTAYYALSVTLPSPASSFSISAAPKGDQLKDACGTYTLNSLGQQTNSTAALGCW
jgi:type IV pilus assembly protein PilE